MRAASSAATTSATASEPLLPPPLPLGVPAADDANPRKEIWPFMPAGGSPPAATSEDGRISLDVVIIAAEHFLFVAKLLAHSRDITLPFRRPYGRVMCDGHPTLPLVDAVLDAAATEDVKICVATHDACDLVQSALQRFNLTPPDRQR
ncbi:hypothetical protein Vretifemale_18657, partial [Volvox reticuliferus]